MLMCRIVPAGVDGRRNSDAADSKDFQKYCIEGAVAVLGSMLLGMVCCCAICLWRKRKRCVLGRAFCQTSVLDGCSWP